MFSFRILRHRAFLVPAVVLVLAGSAVGIAAAQQAPTTPNGQARPTYQQFINALAKRLNITSANLESAVGQARTDVCLPASGAGGPGGFPGFGPGGRGHGGPGGLGDANTAAQAIGITPEQLRTELNGKSLAQVAQAHGKNPADVATALKNAAHQRIDQDVTAGRLTADQATQRKQQVDQRIDQQMTEVAPTAPTGG